GYAEEGAGVIAGAVCDGAAISVAGPKTGTTRVVPHFAAALAASYRAVARKRADAATVQVAGALPVACDVGYVPAITAAGAQTVAGVVPHGASVIAASLETVAGVAP